MAGVILCSGYARHSTPQNLRDVEQSDFCTTCLEGNSLRSGYLFLEPYYDSTPQDNGRDGEVIPSHACQVDQSAHEREKYANTSEPKPK